MFSIPGLSFLANKLSKFNPFQETNRSAENAIQISSLEGESFRFDLNNLRKVLCNPAVIREKVAVISVTGNHRTGKSFLLNYMLRYLRASGSHGWFGRPDTKLTGFEWSGGCDKVTDGIWMWNTLFPIEEANGEKIYVMLIDTEKSRDEETVNVFKHLDSVYDSVKCFLSPRIGNKADGSVRYNGRHSTMNANFRRHFQKLIGTLLDASNLRSKESFGIEMTCGDLYRQCQQCNEMLQKKNGIDIYSIGQANILYYLNRVQEECENSYRQQMRDRFRDKNISDISDLDALHVRLQEDGFEKLKNSRASLSKRLIEEQCDRLRHKLDQEYEIVRRDGEKLIETNARLHDMILKRAIFEEFQANMELKLLSCNTLEDRIKMLRDAREVAIFKFQEGAKSVEKHPNDIQRELEFDIRRYEELLVKESQSSLCNTQLLIYKNCCEKYDREMNEQYLDEPVTKTLDDLLELHRNVKTKLLDLVGAKFLNDQIPGDLEDLMESYMAGSLERRRQSIENRDRIQCTAENIKIRRRAEEFYYETHRNGRRHGICLEACRRYWEENRQGSPADWKEADSDLELFLARC